MQQKQRSAWQQKARLVMKVGKEFSTLNNAKRGKAEQEKWKACHAKARHSTHGVRGISEHIYCCTV